jgi:hypothetical protein
MKVGECKVAGAIDAQVRIIDHFFAQFADTRPRVQNNRAFRAFHQNTGGIAAKSLKSLTANRD